MIIRKLTERLETKSVDTPGARECQVIQTDSASWRHKSLASPGLYQGQTRQIRDETAIKALNIPSTDLKRMNYLVSYEYVTFFT